MKQFTGIALKPCPFCKGKNTAATIRFMGHCSTPNWTEVFYEIYVVCDDCKAKGPIVEGSYRATKDRESDDYAEDRKKAAEKWNRRVK